MAGNVVNFPPAAPTSGNSGGGAGAASAPPPSGGGGGGGYIGGMNTLIPLPRQQIQLWRQDRRARKDDLVRRIYNFIMQNERMQGSRLILADGKVYFFDGNQNNKLYEIDIRNAEFAALLGYRYDLLYTDELCRHVIAAMQMFAYQQGDRREVRRFSFFNRQEFVLYLSQYDGTCARLDGTAVVSVPNGSGAVFLDDDNGKTSGVTAADVGPNGILMPTLIDDLSFSQTCKLTPDMQRCLLAIWIHALAFADYFPTKPLLLAEGSKGSGKCLGRGTPVLMFDGSVKRVEDVKEGDLLMGPDSKPRRVKSTTRGFGPMRKIIPVKGKPWTCNDAHILTLVCEDYKVIDVCVDSCTSDSNGTRVPNKGYVSLFRVQPGKPDPYTITDRMGFKVEKIADNEYFGFTLDGDGRFLLGDFTVTHNTVSLQRIQLAFWGRILAHTVGQNDEEDFGVMLLRSPICLIDNTDDYIPWLRDNLCSYTTGGGWLRRKKYTDDKQIEIRPQAFIALATKNPASFRRDDVADRTLIIKLQRRAAFTPLDNLCAKINQDRPKIYGEWLYNINRIIAALKANPTPLITKHRLADFAHFAAVTGPLIGFSIQEVSDMLDALQDERDDLVLEGDSLVNVLDKWLDDTRNQGRDIRDGVLFKELSVIAQQIPATFYKSPKILAAKLRNVDAELQKYFKITSRPGGGGSTIYQIWRAADSDDYIKI